MATQITALARDGWGKSWGSGANDHFESIQVFARAWLGRTTQSKNPFELDNHHRPTLRFLMSLRIFSKRNKTRRFHSILKGLAARCYWGTLERRIISDVFLVIMTIKEAKTEFAIRQNARWSIPNLIIEQRRRYLREKLQGIQEQNGNGDGGVARNRVGADKRYPRNIQMPNPKGQPSTILREYKG